MYIIAIAWLYVVTLMAATEKTIAAGLLTFVFYGLLPCALFLWILGVKHRKFKRNAQLAKSQQLIEEDMPKPDRTDTKADE